MRVAVLVLGILGGLGAGALGVLWLMNCNKDRDIIELLRSDPNLRDANLGIPGQAFIQTPRDAIREYDRRVRAYPFLLAGLLLGVVGGVLALLGRGKSGAVLLALACLGPAVLNPWSLIFTFLLPVAAGLSLFVRPRPQPDEDEPPARRPRRLRLAEE
jgi:hypothetical protein